MIERKSRAGRRGFRAPVGDRRRGNRGSAASRPRKGFAALARVHDAVARPGVRAVLSHVQVAILSGVALEWNRLRPTLDLRGDIAHALRRAGADTTAVVPSVPVSGGSPGPLAGRVNSERGVIVLTRRVEGLLLHLRAMIPKDRGPQLGEALSGASQGQCRKDKHAHLQRIADPQLE